MILLVYRNVLSQDGIKLRWTATILYVYYEKQIINISILVDACTKELLAWILSKSLEIDFVLETVNRFVENHDISMTSETLIHSD